MADSKRYFSHLKEGKSEKYISISGKCYILNIFGALHPFFGTTFPNRTTSVLLCSSLAVPVSDCMTRLSDNSVKHWKHSTYSVHLNKYIFSNISCAVFQLVFMKRISAILLGWHTCILYWDRTIRLTWDSTYLVRNSCCITIRNRTGLLQSYQRLHWAQRHGREDGHQLRNKIPLH